MTLNGWYPGNAEEWKVHGKRLENARKNFLLKVNKKTCNRSKLRNYTSFPKWRRLFLKIKEKGFFLYKNNFFFQFFNFSLTLFFVHIFIELFDFFFATFTCNWYLVLCFTFSFFIYNFNFFFLTSWLLSSFTREKKKTFFQIKK